MKLKQIAFNHDADDLYSSLNLPEKMINLCRERIFFQILSNRLILVENYNEVCDAPANLRTVSGHLESCLQNITDDTEYEITLFLFHKLEELSGQMFEMYMEINGANANPEAKLKLEFADAVIKMKTANRKNVILPSEMFKRVELIKKSNHNFASYLNLLSAHNMMGADVGNEGSIDDLINGVLEKED